jgi:hypothetical protein
VPAALALAGLIFALSASTSASEVDPASAILEDRSVFLSTASVPMPALPFFY